ncbi:hypothetical protein ACS0TW_03715, partial [Klebsiella michiganensis]
WRPSAVLIRAAQRSPEGFLLFLKPDVRIDNNFYESTRSPMPLTAGAGISAIGMTLLIRRCSVPPAISNE